MALSDEINKLKIKHEDKKLILTGVGSNPIGFGIFIFKCCRSNVVFAFKPCVFKVF